MRLHVHDSDNGSGGTAVLIHGFTSSHRSWHAVEAELVARGYRVLAPDLRGHGDSPRGGATAEQLADDLVDSLPVGVDVAIGHSLGALALLLAAERLRPARAIYSDPAFSFGELPDDHVEKIDRANAQIIREIEATTPTLLRRARPRWSDGDIAAEMAGLARFDPAFLPSFGALTGRDFLPLAAMVPSLVQLADPSTMLDEAQVDLLRTRGFEIVSVPDTGHCIHCDDLPGFMASIKEWI
jgi:pimeloyl-ACP methyl ester carboxylesterase